MSTRVNFVDDEIRDVKHTWRRPAPCSGGPGQTHMLLIRVDYKEAYQFDPRWHPLDTAAAQRAITKLAAACGITNITELHDKRATRDHVLNALEDIGSHMENDDFLVLYYTGHGSQLEAENDSEEDDGMDECWCLVDDMGHCNKNTWLRDTDLKAALLEYIPEWARIVVLSDSCHSGTMCDFEDWEGWQTSFNPFKCRKESRRACCMSGCKDSQTAEGTGKGGVFSHSLMLAVETFQRHGKKEYSVAEVYNEVVKINKAILFGRQSIQLTIPYNVEPGLVPWPLVPMKTYQSPLTKAELESGEMSVKALKTAKTVYGAPSA